VNAPRAWGSDRAEVAPDGVFLLECAVGKGWLPRVAGSQTRSEHPGTAIDWQGEVYEVLAVEALAGTAVRYRLAPWEHGHAIRRIERYDEASERARQAVRVEVRVDSNKRLLTILLSPILGHLPGKVQTAMEHDFGAPAVAMTVVSALPLFLAGVTTILAARIAGMGGTLIVPEWMANHSTFFLYLTFESALRLYSALLMGAPMGSLAGWLVHAAWTQVRDRRPAAAAAPPASGAIPDSDRILRDRYTMVEPLLALLPSDDQEALERHFGFDPLRWGRITSILILFIAGANVLISVAAFFSRTDVFLDFAALVVGGLLIAEQIGRSRTIKKGHPAGSVLGALVRPLARPLLRAARA
jgi:hypothetical protein